MKRRSPHWWCISTAAVAAVVVATGCRPPTGSVKGTVRCQGQAVVGGYLMLVPSDGDYRRSTSSLIVDGHYEATGVSLGNKNVVLMDAHFTHDGTTENIAADATLNPATVMVVAEPQMIDIQVLRPGR